MKLSVITATYNAIEHLPLLVESLRNQVDKDFEWVISDGASRDGTLEYLESITDLKIKITSQEDFGIYDALNRGIKASSGEFYLVMGADDILYPNAIKDYKLATTDEVDIVTAWIDTAYGVSKLSKKPVSWAAMKHFVTGHSVGCILKKSLHEEFGYYSRKYPICADQLFILKVANKEANIRVLERVVGKFSDQGLSGQDIVGIITELFRVKLDVNYNIPLVTFFFFASLFKHAIKKLIGN